MAGRTMAWIDKLKKVSRNN